MLTSRPRCRVQLSRGDAGVSETLAMMRAMVERSDDRGLVARVARQLAHPRDDVHTKMRAVWAFLRRTMRFIPDPRGVELVLEPDQLLERISRDGFAAADCDEVAVLGAALLRALGLPTVFIVTGEPGAVDPETERVRLSHVFFGVVHNGQIIPADPQSGLAVGEWPPRPAVGRVEIFRLF